MDTMYYFTKLNPFYRNKGFESTLAFDKTDLADIIHNTEFILATSKISELKRILTTLPLNKAEKAMLFSTEKEWKRFEQKVGPKDENGCMSWLDEPHKTGYGRFGMQSTTAHRFALWLYYKKNNLDWDSSKVVRHCCGNDKKGLPIDNKLCCNPEHLKLGTPKDNGEDKARANWQRYHANNDLK